MGLRQNVRPMAELLPRLKPDPVPAIHPVPEHVAEGALSDVYARTKRGLGVPWMGVVAMAFAHYPRFYDRLWSALKPVVGLNAFAEACRTLRSAAEKEAKELRPPPISARLDALGYSRREIDEVRACNEVFSVGNMPYLLMATLARLLLEGHVWAGTGSLAPRGDKSGPGAKPTLIEPHHADPSIAAIYADIRETLGLPFVNTDYRAFARWPSYFSASWLDLKSTVTVLDYAPAVGRVHDIAVDMALSLPNPTGLMPEVLRAAAMEGGSVEEVLSVVRLFQWLLPGLVTNVAFLREQLVDAASATA